MALFPVQALNPETGESVMINVALDSGAKRTCMMHKLPNTSIWERNKNWCWKHLGLTRRRKRMWMLTLWNWFWKKRWIHTAYEGFLGHTISTTNDNQTNDVQLPGLGSNWTTWSGKQAQKPQRIKTNTLACRVGLLVHNHGFECFNNATWWWPATGHSSHPTWQCAICGRLTNGNGEKNERSEAMMADIERELTSDSGGVKPTLNMKHLICNVDYTSNEMIQHIWGLNGIGINEPKRSGKTDSFPTQHGTANGQASSESLLIVNASWPDWKDRKVIPGPRQMKKHDLSKWSVLQRSSLDVE